MNTVWEANPKAIDDLRLYVGQGLSASQIGIILSDKYRRFISRNAVIGKAVRLGMHLGSRNKQPRSRPQRRGPVAHARLKHLQQPVLPTPEPLPTAPVMETEEYVTNLMDAKPGQCRWMIGEPQAMMVCGAPFSIEEKFSFCPFHMRIALQPRGRATVPSPYIKRRF